MDQQLKTRIDKEIADNNVVIYMKGTAQMPMCGFSAAAVAIFSQLGIAPHGVNILEDNNLREGLREYSEWPTFPQIYVKGEFIGGCDILREMYANGELQALLKEKGLLAA